MARDREERKKAEAQRAEEKRQQKELEAKIALEQEAYARIDDLNKKNQARIKLEEATTRVGATATGSGAKDNSYWSNRNRKRCKDNSYWTNRNWQRRKDNACEDIQ